MKTIFTFHEVRPCTSPLRGSLRLWPRHKTKGAILPISVLLSVLAGVACAEGDQEKQMKSEAEFTELDSNKDGALNQNEAAEEDKLARDFASVDVDQNGMISVEEYILYKGDATAAGEEAE